MTRIRRKEMNVYKATLLLSEAQFLVYNLSGKAFAICISTFPCEVVCSEFRMISRNILV